MSQSMLKRKPAVQGPLYSFFGGKQSSGDKEIINTASETLASTKRTCNFTVAKRKPEKKK